MTKHDKTVLIVDDEPDFIEVTSMRLAANGFKVITAQSGAEGIRMAKSKRPNLILLDVMMPDLDGGDVAQELSKDPACANTPVIFLTALVSSEEAERRNSETDQEVFLSKTCRAEELLQAVHAALAAGND